MQKENYAGVLSQTLTSSPSITQILPAQVRTTHHNDVVMVGHSSIHLREFMPNGILSNSIAHLELGTQILSANVVSADAREVEVSHPLLLSGRGEIQFSIDGEPYDPAHPPQILVLATALSELVFVYAQILANGCSQFVYARRYVLHLKHWPRKYGRHLAVDSQSRAFAVANMKDSFAFFALKNVREIKSSIDHWNPRDPSSISPFREQVFIQVDGTILRMDFLRSPVTEPQRVVLLLIVANHGVSRLLMYKWDSWQGLGEIKPLRSSGFVLPVEDAFPHLLIPSSRPLSFAIVNGDKLVFYDEVTSSNKRRRPFNIPPVPGDQDIKYWVQWAKPVRHETHRREKEDIFLIREDGLLKTAIVTHDSEQRAHIGFSPGNLGIRVDTAVCALPGEPLEGGDILIACGDTTEGGVYRLQATKFATKVQTIANWSPITDVVALKRHSDPSVTENVRILATTGIHENCASLTELKFGVEAQIVEVIDYEDGTSVDQLWVLHQQSEARQIVLTSHHEHSNAICFERDDKAPFAVGPDNYPSLGFDNPTLAACNIDPDSILQITTSNIHVLGVAWQLPADQEALKGRYICADINPRSGIFVIASHSEQDIQLVGGLAMKNTDHTISVAALPTTHNIDYLPISITTANIAGRNLLIAGSMDGSLHVYNLDQESGITVCRTWAMSSFHKDLNDPKISSVKILSLPDSSHGLVICGFKTGQAMFLELKFQSGDLESALLSLVQFHTLGCTAVSTVVEETSSAGDEAAAYVICETEIFQVRLHHNTAGMDFTLSPLIVTMVQEHHEAHRNPAFNAIAYAAKLAPGTDHVLSGFLVGFTENAFLVLMMGESALIPKDITTIRPTHHVVHSAHLQKCIASVATRRYPSSMEPKQISPVKPSLQMLEMKLADGNSQAPFDVKFGEEGERIRALLHWAPTNGQTHYEMIVIGSEYDGDGRLSYITGKRLSQGNADVSATTFITYSKKTINAICEYGLSSLLVCAGRMLKLVHLDLSTKPPRWEHQAEIELPSRATELKTKGSFIYVATSLHSYMLIREQGQKFQVVGSDRWAGRARNILPYNDGSTLINLVSDHGSRILNFAERPVQGTRPTFEAIVPEAIDKLIHVTSSASGNAHDRFLGTTIDGTVYMFTTLNEGEMALLAFLEALCQPIRSQAEISVASLANRLLQQHGEKMESKGIKTPRFYYTHARGDVLKALLTPGPYNIRFMLQQRIKMEDQSLEKAMSAMESLEEVARPVLGPTKDVVAGVTLWLRKIMSVPLF